MSKTFKSQDRVSWNSEAGRVSGTITRVHTREFKVKGYTHHASPDDSGYAIRNGFFCQPGTVFRGEDGRNHLCQ